MSELAVKSGRRPFRAPLGVGRTYGVCLVGVEGHLVEVEAALSASIPGFTLVGLPDAALGESRDRVRPAVTNSGISWPQRKITVNLSPASLPKSGAGLDLAVAMAVLAGDGLVDPVSVSRTVHLGELGLDGRLRPIRGVLPAVAAAVAAGRPRVVVPEANEREAALVLGSQVVGARCLADVARRHGAEDVAVGDFSAEPDPEIAASTRGERVDLSDVLGQSLARWALEVAAAGGHHLLMVGPPGAGKTMLASRLPTILPDLSDAQAVEVTSIHSLAGVFDPSAGLIRRPPFESPHHTASAPSMVGGGSGQPIPGAVSLAHRGVLFLDEAPEFAPKALQTLRQPLEAGELTVHRAGGVARFPARFQLVLAANPCPCGRGGGKGLDCECTPLARRRYFGRLSGPLMDRVDLRVEVRPATRAERGGPESSTQPLPESSSVVAERVDAARAAQRERGAGTSWTINSEIAGSWLRGAGRLAPRTTAELDRALDRGLLSMRGYDRTLRVAWTIADLAGASMPDVDAVGQALILRQSLGAA